MHAERTLSAPGKLFLSGEYAILWGGVARILAVGPRARLLVRRRVDRQVDIVLEGGRLSGQSTPLGVRWQQEVSPEFRFAAHCIDLALRAVALQATGASFAFAPSPLWRGRKLGLGSSARATVLAAEGARWAASASFDALRLALTAHSEAQGGKGSGGDVAASFAGGLIRYRQYDTSALRDASVKGGLHSALAAAPAVELARLPGPPLPMVYAFSGESASTTSLVREVERTWTVQARQAFVERSDTLSESLELALGRRDLAVVHETCNELQSLLFSLGPTRSAAVERVLALGRSFDCAGKQSGAGGGDGCLFFAPDEQRRRALLEGFEARGIFALPVEVEEGLSGEVAADPRLAGWLDAVV